MQGSADQDAGFKRFRVQDAGFRSPNHITRASGVGLRFQGFQHLGFGVWGLRSGVWGLGFGVWNLGFGVSGVGVVVWGFGFRIQGAGDRSRHRGTSLIRNCPVPLGPP